MSSAAQTVRRRAWPVRDAAAAGITVVLLALWAAWFPHSPDLAAQVYRVRLFATSGFSLWDNNWYDGHYLLSYSLLSPALGSLIGLREIGVVAVACSTACFAALATSRFGSRAPAAIALFAVGSAGDLFIGRITYAVGVAFAMAAVLAATHRRHRSAALLSLACGATSPIAALFLALVGSADALANRTWRRPLAVAAPALIVTLASTIVFPQGGYEPFSLGSLLPAAAGAGLLIAMLPARERALRCGAALYLASLLLAYLVHSPMGSNAVRLGVLLVPPLLVGAVSVEDVRHALARVRPRRATGARPARWMLAIGVVAATLWQINGPLVEAVQASEDPSTQPGFYTPVIDYLSGQERTGPMRIEEVFTRDHWDTVALGRRFALARGWERQLDTDYDALFYAPQLGAAAYRDWLWDNAVRFVAVPNAPLDSSSTREAALIRGGLPFLRRVFRSANWAVYAVSGAVPLVNGGGTLLGWDEDGFRLAAPRGQRYVVRVHYTPFWQVTSGRAVVAAASGGWTAVTTLRPGVVAVDAAF